MGPVPVRRAAPTRSASPFALKRGLGLLLTSIEEEIDRSVAHPMPPPNLLHDLHRDLRRLAGGLAVWGELLVPRDAADVRPMIRRIRRLARLVGRVRDRDVTLGLLEPLLAARGGASESVALRGFLGRLREDGRTGRELLRAFLTTERRGGLLDQVRASLGRPVRAGAREQIVEIFHDEWQVHRRKMHKAHRKARKHPSSERLHRLRIHIRRWRHLSSLADITKIPVPAPIEPGLRSLQDRLGRLHDLTIALTSMPPELSASAPAHRLGATLAREEAAIRRMLDRRAKARTGRRTVRRRAGPPRRRHP